MVNNSSLRDIDCLKSTRELQKSCQILDKPIYEPSLSSGCLWKLPHPGLAAIVVM